MLFLLGPTNPCRCVFPCSRDMRQRSTTTKSSRRRRTPRTCRRLSLLNAPLFLIPIRRPPREQIERLSTPWSRVLWGFWLLRLSCFLARSLKRLAQDYCGCAIGGDVQADRFLKRLLLRLESCLGCHVGFAGRMSRVVLLARGDWDWDWCCLSRLSR